MPNSTFKLANFKMTNMFRYGFKAHEIPLSHKNWVHHQIILAVDI